MGAVVHTLNIRLSVQHLAHIVNDAQDKIIIVDGSLLPALAPVIGSFTTVEAHIVVGEGDTSLLGDRLVYSYAELLAVEERHRRQVRQEGAARPLPGRRAGREAHA